MIQNAHLMFNRTSPLNLALQRSPLKRKSNSLINDYQYREQIRQELFATLYRKLTGNWGLYMVGSSHTGLGSDDYDLDLCLVFFTDDHKGLDENIGNDRSRIMECLENIQKILRDSEHFVVINLIRSAAVPIIKIHFCLNDSDLPVSIDISIQKITSIYATFLFLSYRNVDSRFRQLVIKVKNWAKQNGILSTYSGYLSSYSFTLMVIYFLQKCQTPILPNLQMMLQDDFFKQSLFSSSSENYTRLHYLYWLVRMNFVQENKKTVHELFAEFLLFYDRMQFRKQINISTNIDVKHNPNNPLNALIVVMDPFDQINIATAVSSPEAFDKILTCFHYGTFTNRIVKQVEKPQMRSPIGDGGLDYFKAKQLSQSKSSTFRPMKVYRI